MRILVRDSIGNIYSGTFAGLCELHEESKVAVKIEGFTHLVSLGDVFVPMSVFGDAESLTGFAEKLLEAQNES